MSETAIRIVNLTKEYAIDYSHTNSFKELLMQNIFKGNLSLKKNRKTMLALNNISFEVTKGEALGIIGKNGSGKSTLLKLLSGITTPTSGKIEIYGRMSSILDIGVGFHPELTGRENIYLSGELNGLGRKDIRKRMDEIIDFSGVEKFIDTPVKYYSSGMFVRLAFSVISNIDSDILLLDEVLSVGDASFQIKSYKKLQSMFAQEKTIILVSHNPADIIKLCSRAIVLEDGKITDDGVPGDIITEYMEESVIESIKTSRDQNESDTRLTTELKESKPEVPSKLSSMVKWDDHTTAPGNDVFRLTKIEIRAEGKTFDDAFNLEDELIVEISYWKSDEESVIDVGFTLNQFRSVVFTSNTSFKLEPNKMTGSGFFKVRTVIPSNFLNSSFYSLDVHALHNRRDIIFNEMDVIYFVIHESNDPLISSLKKYFPKFPGSVRPGLVWDVYKYERDAL
jgi:lipopolysaccharide transport system ATP-binding protein